MKILKFVAFLFYRYYSTGPTKDIPYTSTLFAMTMLAGLHIFQILVLFDKISFLPFSYKENRLEKFLITALFLVPIVLLFGIMIKKPEIDVMSYSDAKIIRGNVLLVFYIIVSVALLLLIILFKTVSYKL